MTSFINLMANDVWSEADIVRRTEAMIASEFPAETVAILNRKATGAALGQYTLTEEEQAEIERYAEVCEAARQAGIVARADMALLQSVLDYENAQRLIAGANQETLNLVALRNPAPAEIEQAPEPTP